MKTKLFLMAIAVSGLSGLCGCSTVKDEYNKQGWTPDGFNYTVACDANGMKPAQHYFGLSWSLKDSK